MNQKERMLNGLSYKAWLDGLSEERARAQRICWEFNRLAPDAQEERMALLRCLLGKTGAHLHRKEPLHGEPVGRIEAGGRFDADDNVKKCEKAEYKKKASARATARALACVFLCFGVCRATAPPGFGRRASAVQNTAAAPHAPSSACGRSPSACSICRT